MTIGVFQQLASQAEMRSSFHTQSGVMGMIRTGGSCQSTR